MSQSEPGTVIIERELPHPPHKVWRALTEPHLITEWLMQNDFALALGHKFRLTADWGAVDCEVTEIEPERRLAYSWGAFGLATIVTWTLTPRGAGTHLRMEQSGFDATHKQAFFGAKAGWPRFFAALEQTLARLD